MRQIFNVVSAGIFPGLTLLAISVLTALYASAWQAATILAVLVGIFASVSIYFGEQARIQTLVKQMARSHAEACSLTQAVAESQEQARALSDALADTEAQLRQFALNRLFKARAVIHLIIIDAEDWEEEPPLFI